MKPSLRHRVVIQEKSNPYFNHIGTITRIIGDKVDVFFANGDETVVPVTGISKVDQIEHRTPLSKGDVIGVYEILPNAPTSSISGVLQNKRYAIEAKHDYVCWLSCNGFFIAVNMNKLVRITDYTHPLIHEYMWYKPQDIDIKVMIVAIKDHWVLCRVVSPIDVEEYITALLSELREYKATFSDLHDVKVDDLVEITFTDGNIRRYFADDVSEDLETLTVYKSGRSSLTCGIPKRIPGIKVKSAKILKRNSK